MESVKAASKPRPGLAFVCFLCACAVLSKEFIHAQVREMDHANLAVTAAVAAAPEDCSTLDHGEFFRNYIPLLPPGDFREFHALLNKTRRCQARRYLNSHPESASFSSVVYINDYMSYLDEFRARTPDSSLGTLILADLDISWFIALDAKFQLDPQFVIAYVAAGTKHNLELGGSAHSPNTTGRCYATEISISAGTLWEKKEIFTEIPDRGLKP